jgi:hypothetical protein
MASKIIIQGGKPLSGEVTISGMKNAALPILFATILVRGTCTLENIPPVNDISLSLEILRRMGATVEYLDRTTVRIDTSRIIPGIMPITSVSQVERVVKLSGCYLPKEFTNMIDKYGKNPEDMRSAGINYAIHQILTMFQNGFKNVHVYSMNKPDVAEKIQANLSDIIGK